MLVLAIGWSVPRSLPAMPVLRQTRQGLWPVLLCAHEMPDPRPTGPGNRAPPNSGAQAASLGEWFPARVRACTVAPGVGTAHCSSSSN
eukprot:3205773-Alexandrium_andersonii.AAC.1